MNITTQIRRGKLCLKAKVNGNKLYRVVKDPNRIADEIAEWKAEMKFGKTKPVAAKAKLMMKPLTGEGSHVEDFIGHVASAARSPRSTHAVNVRQRVIRVLAEAKITKLEEITLDKVSTTINKMRMKAFRKGAKQENQPPLSQQSRNHYVVTMKAFTGWLVDHDRLANNPLAKLRKPKVRQQKNPMGYFTEQEILNIIEHTEASPTWRQGFSGPVRAMLYRLAFWTGLRRSELGSLTRESFDIDSDDPVVVVTSMNTKDAEIARQPLAIDLVTTVRPFLANFAPREKLFPGLDNDSDKAKKLAKVIRADAKDANVSVVDANGAKRKFHSIRHAFTTAVATATGDLELTRQLARHKDIKTTQRYLHATPKARREAVELLGRGYTRGSKPVESGLDPS